MLQNFESKSILAKLMATENITVEQRKVSTAVFNVKDRILTVPILDKNISGNLYDLFMGHEVGHALFTPLEGLNKAYDEKINASVCNVIEDVRIERKMKEKYPGLRNSFVKGYRELLDRDFFGIKGSDVNEMSLIDRINMYYKGGPTLCIKFTETEKQLLTEVEATETFDDVLDIARRISKYMEEMKLEQKIMSAGQEKGDSDDMEDYDGDVEYSDDQHYSDEDGAPGEEDDELEVEGNQNSSGADASDEIRSVTDDNYRKNENKLFSDDNKQFVYVNLPKMKFDEVILDHKELWNMHRGESVINERANELYQNLMRDNNKVVSYLAKEFEMRKNADQLKRASVARTGELNMSKIFSYQFADDIFKKVTVMPGGKSHGLVMFLDWSGSMTDHIGNTVKQLLALVMFCKKVNIPYEVFAFANNDRSDKIKQYQSTPKENDMVFGPFRLLNMLSSRMAAHEFKYAATALVGMSSNWGYTPSWMNMNSTPMYQAMIAAMDYIPFFQKKYKLQMVNTVFLTDGDGDRPYGLYRKNENDVFKVVDFSSMVDRDSASYTRVRDVNIVVTDTVTKNQESFNLARDRMEMSKAFITLLRQRTNCHILGFYVLSSREFNRHGVDRFFENDFNKDKIKVKFRKEKSVIVTNAGFDEYYLLRSEGLDTSEDAEFEYTGKTTTRSLVSAFTKFSGNRHTSRVILNRFIGMIV